MIKAIIINKENNGISDITEALDFEGINFSVRPWDDSVKSALKDKQPPDIVIIGYKPGENLNGLEILFESKRINPNIPYLVLSPGIDIVYVVRSKRLGAFDHIEIPCTKERILDALKEALKKESLRDPILMRVRSMFIAETHLSIKTANEIAKMAKLPDCDVLLTGPTGTGKDVAARAIHMASSRSDEPFLAENCANISKELAESELFGHEKGAFTGATDIHRGAFERTGNGTLFLDEIEELLPSLQAKLLRVVETREYRRIRGEEMLPFKGRIIYASNKDLAEEVKSNAFRKDLYHRINTPQIVLPPLNKRPDDIIPLAEHFLKIHGGERKLKLSKETVKLLKMYSYPGNVRELEKFIKHAIHECENDTIQNRHLPLEEMEISVENRSDDLFKFEHFISLPYLEAIDKITAKYDREYLPLILKECGNNLTQAAKRADIDPKTFRTKWEKCGLGFLSTR
jgi:two-component system, NtrC family, nitrogen regulation response regulator NtrX